MAKHSKDTGSSKTSLFHRQDRPQGSCCVFFCSLAICTCSLCISSMALACSCTIILFFLPRGMCLHYQGRRDNEQTNQLADVGFSAAPSTCTGISLAEFCTCIFWAWEGDGVLGSKGDWRAGIPGSIELRLVLRSEMIRSFQYSMALRMSSLTHAARSLSYVSRREVPILLCHFSSPTPSFLALSLSLVCSSVKRGFY